jgi:hypothetical protein
MKNKLLLHICLFLFFSVSKVFSQYQLQGILIDKKSLNPIPFAVVSIPNSDYQYFSDINGKFSVQALNLISSVKITHPSYYQVEIETTNLNSIGEIKLYLEPNESVFFKKNDAKIIKNVVANRKRNDFHKSKGFSYKSYNKVKLETGENPIADQAVLAFLKKIISIAFLERAENNTLFIAESVTEKRYRNKVLNNEIVVANKTCGIKDPSILSLNTQYQFYSFYESLIQINSLRYISPLSKSGLVRYKYYLQDSIVAADYTYYLIAFEPRNSRYFNGFEGFCLIDKKTSGIVAIDARPPFNRHVDISIKQQFQQMNGFWVPVSNIIRGGLLDLGEKRKNYLLQSETYFDEVVADTLIAKRVFTDNFLEISNDAESKTEDYWQNNRLIPLTDKETDTYDFYNKFGNLTNLDKFLIPLKSLNEGKIPIRKVDFDLRNFIRYNLYERTRLNFGFNTNEKLSDRFFAGAYLGYGFDDNKWKFGFNTYYAPNRFKYFRIGYRFKNDITEAGNTEYRFSKRQFSSEPIRTLEVSKFDAEIRHHFYVNSRILKNLYVHTGFDYYSQQSLFDYQFKDFELRNRFHYTDFSVAFKYHYGELFVKNRSRRLSIGSQFPAFWLQITRGAPVFNTNFDYTKIDAKIEDNIFLVGIGKLTFQATAGVVLGDIPYGNLYVGRGAFRNASVVIHNSFETMRFNEFLSDRHFSLFISHDLGRIRIKKKGDQPSLEILHNMGWGSLSKPQIHHNISFKTMENGFFESGFFINDILAIRVYSIKAGIGVGAFYRYGMYTNPLFKENVVFKVATNFNF